jgi:hypothetical protein
MEQSVLDALCGSDAPLPLSFLVARLPGTGFGRRESRMPDSRCGEFPIL